MTYLVVSSFDDGSFSYEGPFPSHVDAQAYIDSEDDQSVPRHVECLFRPDVDANGLQHYADGVHAQLIA